VTQVSHEVAQERDAAIKQVAQAVATERDQIAHIATTAVAAERKIILTECNAALQTQRELLISDLAAATERATYRFFILECGVVILAIALVAVLIRRTRAAARTHELVER
jgi:negative regulator of replication initiation